MDINLKLSLMTVEEWVESRCIPVVCIQHLIKLTTVKPADYVHPEEVIFNDGQFVGNYGENLEADFKYHVLNSSWINYDDVVVTAKPHIIERCLQLQQLEGIDDEIQGDWEDIVWGGNVPDRYPELQKVGVPDEDEK